MPAHAATYSAACYHGAMSTTIDAAGRVVIPKALRERLGLGAGSEVELREYDGRIEIEPASPPTTLTDAMVRNTLERTRR